jgi:hypothetical protein
MPNSGSFFYRRSLGVISLESLLYLGSLEPQLQIEGEEDVDEQNPLGYIRGSDYFILDCMQTQRASQSLQPLYVGALFIELCGHPRILAHGQMAGSPECGRYERKRGTRYMS